MLTLSKLVFVTAIMVGGAAQSATLSLVDPSTLTSSTKLFTSEWKRDRNVDNDGQGGQRGHDVFLRNGTETSGPSRNVSWGVSGSVYDWSLSYDGDVASLVFDGVSSAIDVDPDGSWNAVQFFVSARDANRFTSSASTVSVSEVNGASVSGFSLSASDGGALDQIFALTDFGAITSLSGQLAFDFVVADGAKGSPNSRLAVNVKALDVTPTPAPIPLPAAAWMLLAGIGGLAAVGRRRGPA